MWIKAEFSGFGPHGWRDIVETLDRRDNGCSPIKIDAWQALARKALVVNHKHKIVFVNYKKMGHPHTNHGASVPVEKAPAHVEPESIA
jgi:hypothetical protein